MNYKEWLILNHPNKRTVQNYYRAIYGSRVNDLLYQISNTEIPLYEITDLEKLEQVIFQLKKSQEFLNFDAKGHRMYSCGLDQFFKYRQQVMENDFVDEDFKFIETDTALSETMKLSLRRARIGQGNYRRELLKQWKFSCSVTGYRDERFLIASHIKPWRLSSNSERLDRFNGLILTPNLDKAFDRGLISFAQKDGRIIISNYFSQPEKLGIYSDLKLLDLPFELKNYLDFHESQIFLKTVRQ